VRTLGTREHKDREASKRGTSEAHRSFLRYMDWGQKVFERELNSLTGKVDITLPRKGEKEYTFKDLKARREKEGEESSSWNRS